MVASSVCIEIYGEVFNALRNRVSIYNEASKLICLKNNGEIIPTPTSYIAFRTGDYKIFNYRPGEIVIKVNAKERDWTPFNHPHVRAYHEYMMTLWNPPRVDVNVFMPCTRKKPYRTTITHKMIKFYAERLSSKGVKVALYSISEPMLIVPYELEVYYPLSNYDFPPQLMSQYEKELMIKLISILLPKFLIAANFNLFILPRHHEYIVKRALSEINTKLGVKLANNVKLWPYGPRAFRSFKEAFTYLDNLLLRCNTQRSLHHLKLHK